MGCCIPLQLARGSLTRSSVICVPASPACIRGRAGGKKAYFAFLLHFFCLFIYHYSHAASSGRQAQFLETPLLLKKTNLEILWWLLRINAILRKKGCSMHVTCLLSSSALSECFQGGYQAAALLGYAARLQVGCFFAAKSSCFDERLRPPLPTSAERLHPASRAGWGHPRPSDKLKPFLLFAVGVLTLACASPYAVSCRAASTLRSRCPISQSALPEGWRGGLFLPAMSSFPPPHPRRP